MRSIPFAALWTAGPAVVAAMIGGLALALSALLVLASDNPSDGQLRAEQELALAPGQRISQSFTTRAEGLASVMLRAGTVEPNGAMDAELVVVLRLDLAAKKLAGISDKGEAGRWRISAADLGAYDWHTLTLPYTTSIPAGQAVVLEAWDDDTLNAASRREPRRSTSSLSVWTSTGNAYPAGVLSLDGRRLVGDLAFRVDYRPGRLAKLRWLLATTGYPPQVAAVLIYGMLASGLAALYSFGRSMISELGVHNGL